MSVPGTLTPRRSGIKSVLLKANWQEDEGEKGQNRNNSLKMRDY
jgi:hypothetical protein